MKEKNMERNEVLATLKGVNGQLDVYKDKVTITRKGLLSKLTQGFFAGERSIYIKQITSIRFKQAGLIFNGFIQFTLPGTLEYRKGMTNQSKDENTVMFSSKNKEDALRVKDIVESLIFAA